MVALGGLAGRSRRRSWDASASDRLASRRSPAAVAHDGVASPSLLVARRGFAGYAATPARRRSGSGSAAVPGAFIVFTITVASPRIGTTATIAIFVAGQLAMGAAIDRYGLFGLEQIALSWRRLVGIALLAAGAALTLRK